MKELSNLGYSLAVATDKHLWLDLSFTRLNKADYFLTPYELYSTPGFLLPVYSLGAFCNFRKKSGLITSGTPGPVTDLPDAHYGHFEILPKEKKCKTFIGI